MAKVESELGYKHQYCSDAVIPRQPWREPSNLEYELLHASQSAGEWNAANRIGLLKVPEAVLSPLVRMGVESVTNAEQLQQISLLPEYGDAIRGLQAFVCQFSSQTNDVRVLGPFLKTAGLATTTYDNNGKCFVGLHLDSWDRLPLEKRDKARNRFCVNIGKGDRYLLYINLTLKQMLKSLISLNIPSENSDFRSSHWGEEFMRRFPSYPVIKLRLAPHEAYIAPTENIVHDATTEGCDYPDLSFTVLGHFQLLNSLP